MPAPLAPEVKARLRQAVVERILPRFDGDPTRRQTLAAAQLKVHPSAINRLVNRSEGGSVDMIEKVEKMLGDPPGTILGYRGSAPGAPRFRDVDGFSEAVTDAAKRCLDNKIPLSKQDLENAGDYRLSPNPARITADLLIQVALALMPDSATPRKPKRKHK